MRKVWFLIPLAALIFLALALGACGGEATPTSTPLPPTPTPTPVVITPTPQPATPTPTPPPTIPTATPTPSAQAGGPPPIPHTLAGRDNCLACHETGVVGPKIPADHVGRTNETCQLCHKPQ